MHIYGTTRSIEPVSEDDKNIKNIQIILDKKDVSQKLYNVTTSPELDKQIKLREDPRQSLYTKFVKIHKNDINDDNKINQVHQMYILKYFPVDEIKKWNRDTNYDLVK